MTPQPPRPYRQFLPDFPFLTFAFSSPAPINGQAVAHCGAPCKSAPKPNSCELVTFYAAPTNHSLPFTTTDHEPGSSVAIRRKPPAPAPSGDLTTRECGGRGVRVRFMILLPFLGPFFIKMIWCGAVCAVLSMSTCGPGRGAKQLANTQSGHVAAALCWPRRFSARLDSEACL